MKDRMRKWFDRLHRFFAFLESGGGSMLVRRETPGGSTTPEEPE